MAREIVVFERDERHTGGEPELDWRLLLQALPSGAAPLAIADRNGFTAHCGQWFYREDVVKLAEEQSGFEAAA